MRRAASPPAGPGHGARRRRGEALSESEAAAARPRLGAGESGLLSALYQESTPVTAAASELALDVALGPVPAPASPQSSPVPEPEAAPRRSQQSKRQPRTSDEWTLAELARLQSAVAAHRDNWEEVTKEVESHTRVECQRKPQEEVAAGRLAPAPEPVQWSEAELAKLRLAVEAHSSNWRRVAEEVASNKTAEDCRRQAFREIAERKLVEPPGLRRVPHVERLAWSAAELERLHWAVKQYGRKWSDVAAYVRTRSNEDCRKKATKEDIAGALPEPLGPKQARKPAQKWFREELLRLKEAVAMYGRVWEKVAEHVGGTRTPQDCINKVNKEVIVGRMTEPDGKSPCPAWSDLEVAKLRQGVTQHGRRWRAVAEFVGSRTPLECRFKVVRELSQGRTEGLLAPKRGKTAALKNALAKQQAQAQAQAQQAQLPSAIDTDPKGGWMPAFTSMPAPTLPPPLPLF
jgi:hypothetical protein